MYFPLYFTGFSFQEPYNIKNETLFYNNIFTMDHIWLFICLVTVSKAVRAVLHFYKTDQQNYYVFRNWQATS